MNDPRLASKEINLSDLVSRRLRQIEALTNTSPRFWCDNLKIGSDAWRQYKNRRNHNAVIKREADILSILDGIGFRIDDGVIFSESNDDIVAQMFAESNSRQGKIRTIFQIENFDGFHKLNIAQLEDLSRKLQLSCAPSTRSNNHSKKTIMLVGSTPSKIEASLYYWINDSKHKPDMPIVHFNASSYVEPQRLFRHIFESICPDLVANSLDLPAQVALLKRAVAENRFLLIIENADAFSDKEMSNENSFIITDPIVYQIIVGCFAFNDFANAKLILTGKKPLHGINNKGDFISVDEYIGDEISNSTSLKRYSETDDVTHSACKQLVNKCGGRDSHTSQRELLSNIVSFTRGDSAPFRIGPEIGMMCNDGRILLRLIAASVDGLKIETMIYFIRKLIDAFPDHSINLYRALDDDEIRANITGILRWISPALIKATTLLSIGGRRVSYEVYRIYSDDVRISILNDWENSASAEASFIYGAVASAALLDAELIVIANNNEVNIHAIERYIQCSHALLSKTYELSNFSDRPLAPYESVRRAIINCETVSPIDVFNFVYVYIWKGVLESGNKYLLLKKFGLFNTKLQFLLKIFNTSTAVPINLDKLISASDYRRDWLDWANEHFPITKDVLLAIAITSMNICEYTIATAAISFIRGYAKRVIGSDTHRYVIAGSGEEYAIDNSDDEFFYKGEKIDIDLDIRTCKFDSALRKIDSMLIILERSNRTKSQDNAVIDLYSRKIDIGVSTGDRDMSYISIESIRDICGDISVSGALRGSNGRRIIRYLLDNATKKRHNTDMFSVIRAIQNYIDTSIKLKFDNDITGALIDHARALRISSRGPNDYLIARDKLDVAMGKAMSFRVSRLTYLDAIVERSRMMFAISRYIGGEFGETCGFDAKKHINYALTRSRSYNSPIHEAESLLLIYEMNAVGSQYQNRDEALRAHDDICSRCSIRVFESARTLATYGHSPTEIGAW